MKDQRTSGDHRCKKNVPEENENVKNR